MTLLAARGLTVRLGGATVLSGVDLAIGRAEIVTIVGPNGSGKSTLLRALLGVLAPESGSVARAPDLRIGYVPQRLGVDRTLPITVRRFLSLPQRHDAAATLAALARVGLEPEIAGRQVAALSGGQLQRVLLARALLGRPQVLLLDEPTQGLDQPGEAAFYRLIEAIRSDTGCAVLMVSHDLHVVMAASDRVVCLNGHICCEGTPHVVSAAPEYRALFGLGTQGALALYRHEHDHSHDDAPAGAHHHHPNHDHGHGHDGHHHAAGAPAGRAADPQAKAGGHA
jgi:zinc transport system ATP-binding protein